MSVANPSPTRQRAERQASYSPPVWTAPRLASRKEVAQYCGISDREVTNWVAKNLLPPPVTGTRRWDLKAVDHHLDQLSGLTTVGSALDPFDAWMAQNHARRA